MYIFKVISRSLESILFFAALCVIVFLMLLQTANAATLSLSPNTGVYTAGSTFPVRLALNTQGKPINAAEGTISFNPKTVSVVSISQVGSIFNLWTTEPTFSNSAGTISFGGGSPTGYSGNSGTIMTVTLRAQSAGSPKLSFSSGSVLAADGQGTNILTNMSGGTYTIGAVTADPEPEQVFIPSANTPGRPVVSSKTHSDPSAWHKTKKATLNWEVPAGVIAVRTLLDTVENSIPQKVYENPINEITLEELDEGVQYFHLQFQNSDGWGKIAHYRLAIDSKPPESFTINFPENRDAGSSKQALRFEVVDAGSGVAQYLVSVDGKAPISYSPEATDTAYDTYILPPLTPGSHNVVVEAFDYADNSIVGTFNFDISAFEKPVITEYPERINNQVIPVIKGTTRPRSSVVVTLTQINARDGVYTTPVQSNVIADESGQFIFIPDGRLAFGVYEVSAVAFDEQGAQSEVSDPVKIIVEEPGFVRLGNFAVSFLSLFIPLMALTVLATFGMWYLWHRFAVTRRRIKKETFEAEDRLAIEFDEIVNSLKNHTVKLKKSRKGKLTKAETALIKSLEDEIHDAEEKIKKEITDIEKLVK